MRVWVSVCVHARAYTYKYTPTHTLNYSHTDTHTHSLSHRHTHIHIRTYIHNYLTYIHTYLSGAFGRSDLRLALDDENIGDTIRDVGSGDPWRHGGEPRMIRRKKNRAK